MEIEKIISLTEQPGALADSDREFIDELIERFPYFTLPRIVRTKHLKATKSLDLKNAIKQTAVACIDREKLYELLFRESVLKQIDDENREEKTPGEEKSKSAFTKPVVFEGFGKKIKKDPLEELIIGSVIEHVLTDEIEQSYPDKKPSADSGHTTSPQRDKLTFSDWLKMLDGERMKSWRKKQEKTGKSEQEIIDAFLQKGKTRIDVNKEPELFTPENLARISDAEDSGFVTETLANIYAQQGNIRKAIDTYKKLMLNNPEKKTYFAARIEELENKL